LKAMLARIIFMALIAGVILAPAAPATAQYPTPLPTPLGFDDFEDGTLAGWEIVSTGGEVLISEKPPDGHFLESKGAVFCMAAQAPEWTDYNLRVKVLILQDESWVKGVKVPLLQGQAAVRFRYLENKDNFDCYVAIFSPSEIIVRKIHGTGSSVTQLTPLGSVPVQLELSTWYTVDITCFRQKFEIEVNGEHQFAYLDEKNPILSGTIGLGTLGESYAVFDDVSVEVFSEPSPTTASSPLASAAPPSATPSPTATPPVAAPTASPQSSGTSIRWETIAALATVAVSIGSVGAWFISRKASGSRKRHLRRLLNEVDDIYIKFKMNTKRCEAELYRLRDIVIEKLKEGKITGESYAILEKRLDGYLEEIEERIIDEKLGGYPSKLRNALTRMLKEGSISEEEFSSIEKLLIATTELSDTDKADLKDSLERWRKSYLKKSPPDQAAQ